MNTWVPFSDDAVLKTLAPSERATLNNIQGATNALPDFVREVGDEFRQAITDAGTDISAAGGNSLPAGFIGKAAALARWRWLDSIPSAKNMQTATRKEAAEAAEQLIKDIGSGDRQVASPGESVAGTATQVATKPDPARASTRKKLDGLI